MKKSQQTLKWFEFWRGTLSSQEMEEVRTQIAQSPENQREFEENRELFEGLKGLARQQAHSEPEAVEEIMSLVNQGFSHGGFMEQVKRVIFSFKAIVLLVLVSGLWFVANRYRSESSQFVESLASAIEQSAGAWFALGATAIIAWMLLSYSRFSRARGVVALLTVLLVGRVVLEQGVTPLQRIDPQQVEHAKPASPVTREKQDEVLSVQPGKAMTEAAPAPAERNTSTEVAKRSLGGRTITYNDQRVVESSTLFDKLGSYLGSSTDSSAPEPKIVGGAARPFGKQKEVDSKFAPQTGGLGYAVSDLMVAPAEDREQYGSYDENPRFDPNTTPLSTFSIDVDTGSYTNMRRFLSAGRLPPKDAVRIEEFVNYFDYGYESASDKPFTVNFEAAPSAIDSGYHLLKVGVKARTVAVDDSRGWNLVFLVDVSGSMADATKLPLVKESLKLLTQKLRPVDRIALVTYAGNAGMVLDSTPGSEKQRILSAIEALGAGGSTNGSGGIELAYSVAAKNMIKGSVNRVVLATDGDFNVGISSFDALMKLIEEKRKTGITLTTLGFGQGNIQEKSMEQLANRGNGNYFYIDSFREARRVLDSGLVANMEVVAKDVKLQMEFNPAIVKQYRLIGFDNRRLNREDFTNDKKDAGEIGSGHTVTALYEIVLNDSPLAKKLNSELRYQREATPTALPNEKVGELGFLRVRYKEPEGETSIPVEYPIATSLVHSEAAQASDDFRFASAVAYFGEILRESQFVGSYTLDDVLTAAKGSKGSDSEGLRAEFIKLVEDARAISKK